MVIQFARAAVRVPRRRKATVQAPTTLEVLTQAFPLIALKRPGLLLAFAHVLDAAQNKLRDGGSATS